MRRINQYIQSAAFSPIAGIMKYASQFEDTISLGQGTPHLPTPSFIYNHISHLSKTNPDLGKYPSVKLKNRLCELIAEDLSKEYQIKADPKHIVLSVGGLGGLYASFSALLNPGDEVIFFDPSYPTHLDQLHQLGAQVKFVPLIENDGWSLDKEKLANSIGPKTKLIILTTPNNPTGTIFSQPDIEFIAQQAISHDLYLVVDGAYQFLTYNNIQNYNFYLIPGLSERTILIKSFSKEYAMSGWRIGYVYMPSQIIDYIGEIAGMMATSPATISIEAAIEALSNPLGKSFLGSLNEEFTKSKNCICARMDKLGNLFSYQKPQGAFYVFPKVLQFPELSSQEIAEKLIRETGVVTVPGEGAGPAGQRHLRFSYAASPETINQAFDRLDIFAANYHYS